MPGEAHVGSAKVTGHFDGEGMNDEIVDSVASAGPGVEREGEKQGDQFGKSFGDRMRRRLSKHLPAIAKTLNEKMDGRATGERLGKEIADGATRGSQSDWVNYWDEVDRQAAEGGRRSGDSFVDSMVERVRRVGGRVSAEMGERLASRPQQVQRGIERAFDDDFADRVGDRFANSLMESMEKRLVSGNLGAALSAALGSAVGGGGRGQQGSFGDRIGRIFGAGSRNNFLNILGKSLGNVLNLTEKVRRGASSMFGTFTEGFRGAATGATALQRTMAGLSAVGSRAGAAMAKGFGSLAKSGPAAAVGVVVLIGTLSAMATVLGGLIGIVTALAATIVSGLVGALAVAGGAIMAVVAAGGLLTAAFMSMTNAQRDAMVSAFTPLREVMTGIGQVIMREVVPAFETWSRNLQQAVFLIAPMAQTMGQTFAQMGNIITKSLSGPGFANFAYQMGVYLPAIVGRLSYALGAFLNGLTGMFAAITPAVARFAEYLRATAERFSNWANSAGGQNAIVDFVDRALVSLESLWNFTREVFGFIGDLMFSVEAQQAGNTMFDAMREAVEGFRDAIANGDLERWFEDAANLGSALWKVMQALGDVFMALYNSGVMDGIATSLSFIAWGLETVGNFLEPMVDALGWVTSLFSDFSGMLGHVASSLGNVLGPLGAVVDGIISIGDTYNRVKSWMGLGGGGGTPDFWSDIGSFGADYAGSISKQARDRMQRGGGGWSVPKLRDFGADTRAKTYEKYGGTMPDPSKGSSVKPKYVNPYEDWANSLIKTGPRAIKEMREQFRTLRKEAVKAVREAAKSIDHEQLGKDLLTNVNDLRKTGGDFVKKAQDGVNAAARSLASANDAKEAARALREVKRAQKDLKAAQKMKRQMDRASTIINKQRYATKANAQALLRGQRVQSATLADYALARQSLAVAIEKANVRLEEAIALRDQFKDAVTSSILAFGNIATVQKRTIDGVEQALTAGDVTDNLRDRLEKIREFQNNLRLLLAQGLSDAAYKQIVEAGVDGGGADIADALVEGGVGAIGEVNNLVSQIGATADALGKETSSRLYQAGVDAAQGLLDGLTKLDAQLERAAYLLGEKIAKQVKRALGIKSPSTVMMDAMDDVGDGQVIGLDKQHAKVGRAADRLAGRIAISPSVALDEARIRAMAPSGVSGNQKVGDVRLTVITPTKDPIAVAHEAINELTGKL